MTNSPPKKRGWHSQDADRYIGRSSRPKEEVLLDKARDFDKQFPIGAAVWFWRSLPGGPKLATQIEKAAFIAASLEVCCFVKGVSGYVSCDFITRRGEPDSLPPLRPPTSPAVATCHLVVAIFPKPSVVTRQIFEEAAGRPVILAGGGSDDVLYGVRTRPGESPRELRDELRRRFPMGKIAVEDYRE